MAKRKKPGGGGGKGDEDEIKRNLRELGAKITQRLDQTLADLRDEYRSLDPPEQRSIKQWVNELAKIDEPAEPVAGYFKARIEILIQGAKNRTRRLVVPVRSLKKAIAFWDRGEEYVPTWGDHS
jgi:hypothetical protein